MTISTVLDKEGEEEEIITDNLDEDDQKPYLCCPDSSCDRIFKTSYNLERHMIIGKHTVRTIQCSGLHAAVKIYSTQCDALGKYQDALYDTANFDTTERLHESSKEGWALKGKRTTTRFSEKIKKYLQEVCLSCERTGTRPDYSALSEELRKVTNENGDILFHKNDWLSPSQIRGYIAQFLSKMRLDIGVSAPKKQKIELKEVSAQEDEKLSEIIDMIDTNGFNSGVSALVNEVFAEVNM